MTTNAKPKRLVLQLLGGKLYIRKMQVLLTELKKKGGATVNSFLQKQMQIRDIQINLCISC
jgi:hypothetical protein